MSIVGETHQENTNHNTQKVTSWSYDMKVHAEQRVERHRPLAKKSVSQLRQVETPCIDDLHLKKNVIEAVGGWALVCAQHFVDSEHPRKSSHKVEQSLRPEIEVDNCKLGLFQDASFAADLQDSSSASSGVLYIIGERTFVPMSWMCKKQTAVSRKYRGRNNLPG